MRTRTARAYRTTPAPAEAAPARPGRGAAPQRHPTGPRAEYERGGPMRTEPSLERLPAVERELVELLREVTAEVEAGRTTTKLYHRLTVAGKLAGEAARTRLAFKELPEPS